MATVHGWPSQEKDSDSKPDASTVSPVRQKQRGLDTVAHQFAQEIGTDLIEAGSTTTVLNLTAHSALVGDIIRFTSGSLSPQDVLVTEVDTNTVTVAEVLTSAPGAGDGVTIYRFTYPQVSSTGGIQTSQGPLVFTRDGSDQEVTEDTGTPANNRPLPVKLISATGDVTITADNLEVQLSHSAATPDSVQIGDGTDVLAIAADGSIAVTDNGTTLSVDDGGGTLTVDDGGTTLSVDDGAGSLTIDSTQLPADMGQEAMADSVPVAIASDQSAVPVTQNTSAVTHQGFGEIVGTALTGTYAGVITPAGDVSILYIFNTCDETIEISLDAGTTTNFRLETQESVTIDLSQANLHLPSGTTLSARHNGVVPTAGTVRMTVIR